MSRSPAIGRLRAVPTVIRTPADIALAVRMFAWSLVLPVLKHALPLPRLARLMWSERAGERRPKQEAQVATLARWIYRLRPLAWRDNCLERSLLVYRYLSRSGAEPRLVVAVGLDDEGVAGHVWVTVDGEPVNDSRAGLQVFSPVVTFGAHARRDPPAAGSLPRPSISTSTE